jgi:MipA family protein
MITHKIFATNSIVSPRHHAASLGGAMMLALFVVTPASANDADMVEGRVARPAYPADQGQSNETSGTTIDAARNDTGDSSRWGRDSLTIAVGALSSPTYDGSNDRRWYPGAYVRGQVSGFAFSSRGTALQLDLLREEQGARTDWQFGPVIGVRDQRTGDTKDAAVNALGKRKLAVEAGLVAGVSRTGILTSDYDELGFSVMGLYDVSGRHKSWIVTPTIEYGTPLSKRAYIGVSASANIYGKGYGRYYFDVDPAASTASGLPVYNRAGDKSVVGKYNITAAGAYSLSGDLRKGLLLAAGVQYGRISGRYADSPIVSIAGDADQWIFGAGIAYNF